MADDFGQKEIERLQEQRDQLFVDLHDTRARFGRTNHGNRPQATLEKLEVDLLGEIAVVENGILVHSSIVACVNNAALIDEHLAEEQAVLDDRRVAAELGGDPLDAENAVVNEQLRFNGVNAEYEAEARLLVFGTNEWCGKTGKVQDREKQPEEGADALTAADAMTDGSPTESVGANSDRDSDAAVADLSKSKNEETRGIKRARSPLVTDEEAERAAKRITLQPQCSLCLEDCDHEDGILLTCPDQSHRVHLLCLNQAFEQASHNRETWPARCCEELPSRKTFEFNLMQPIYCSSDACDTALGGKAAEKIAIICPDCSSETCLRCNKALHTGVCHIDGPDEALVQLAKEKGWKTCPNCSSIIELKQGCHHMTCICKTEFCYKCGKHWVPNHGCDMFDEDMLYAEAARVFIRRKIAAGQDWDPAERVAQFRRMQQDLRDDGAACDHGGLHRVEVPGACDECGDVLDKYLMRGCGCNIEVCLWCSAIHLDNAEALLEFRRRFVGRPEIRSMDEADQIREWNIFKNRQFELRARDNYQGARLRDGETEAQRDVRVDTARRRFERRRGDVMQARREEQRRVIAEMGGDLAALDARFRPN